MIYAKCIKKRHIAKTKEEFQDRQKAGEHVYMEGMTTHSATGEALLYAVPLNLIFDCLKYGKWVAIVGEDQNEYPRTGNILRDALISKEQHVYKIMPIESRETIDYIFNEIKKTRAYQSQHIR